MRKGVASGVQKGPRPRARTGRRERGVDLKEAAENTADRPRDSGRGQAGRLRHRTLLPSECGRLQPSEVETTGGGSVRVGGGCHLASGEVFPGAEHSAGKHAKQRPWECQGVELQGDGLCLPSQPPGVNLRSLAASPLGLLRGNPAGCSTRLGGAGSWPLGPPQEGMATPGSPSFRVQGQTVFPQHQHRGSGGPARPPRSQSAHPEMTFQPGLKVSRVGRYRLRCWACRCCCCSFSPSNGLRIKGHKHWPASSVNR